MSMMDLIKKRTGELQISGHLPPPFDVASIDDLEQEMAHLLEKTPLRELPMPDYVSHDPQASEIGKLTAAAIALEYDNTAKEIEALVSGMSKLQRERADDTVRVVREYEAFVEQVREATQACNEAAQAYKDKAASIFTHIQKSQIVAQDVRKACAELQRRISLNEPEARINATLRQEDKSQEDRS